MCSIDYLSYTKKKVQEVLTGSAAQKEIPICNVGSKPGSGNLIIEVTLKLKDDCKRIYLTRKEIDDEGSESVKRCIQNQISSL